MNRAARWALGLVIAASAGCSGAKPAPPPPKPPEVLVAAPTVREVTDYEDFTGRIEAVKTVEVRARVTGYLEKFLFDEGRDVKEGDVLFAIDARPYKAALDQAQAEVAQAEAQMARADADFQRARTTYSRDAISRSEYDLATASFAEAKAAVGIAEAKRDTAALNHEWTRVTAPISGQVSRRMVDPGNLVQADSTPLTSIVATDQVYVLFDIDERTLLKLRRLISGGKIPTRDQRKLIVGAALVDEDRMDFPHQGAVDFTDNRVDPGTGTLRVRAVFDNPAITEPGAAGQVRRIMSPGLFVRVRLPVGSPHEALLVPEKAIGSDQGQKYVFVVNEDEEVVRSDIEVGSIHDGLREVLRGLAPTEQVIVSGVQRVRPKIKVLATPLEEFVRESKARAEAADAKTKGKAEGPGAAP